MKSCAPILILATIVLSGCLRGPVYKRSMVPAPPTFRGQASADSISLADQAWWNIYSDPLLEDLIKEAGIRYLKARKLERRAKKSAKV